MSYGRRLTDREYQAAIAHLYSDAPPMPSKDEDRELRRREFALVIDHRLGLDFPKDLRQELWSIQQELEKKRLKLAALSVLGRLPFGALAGKAHSVAQFMVDEYAKVIGREDAEQFFGLAPGEPASLPVDSGHEQN